MDLQPYGPIEEAIQKSIIANSTSPKPSYGFLQGVIATLLAGYIVFVLVKNKKKDRCKQTNDNETAAHNAPCMS